jgi:hypothetical protein
VTNTGKTPLTNISVYDSRLGIISYYMGDTDGDGILDVGETWKFMANYIVTPDDHNPLVNVAIVYGTDKLGHIVTDIDTTIVTIITPQ